MFFLQEIVLRQMFYRQAVLKWNFEGGLNAYLVQKSFFYLMENFSF